MSANELTTMAVGDYRGGLVRQCGQYRSWSFIEGRWRCIYTSNSLAECRRFGSTTLPFPEEPDSDCC